MFRADVDRAQQRAKIESRASFVHDNLAKKVVSRDEVLWEINIRKDVDCAVEDQVFRQSVNGSAPRVRGIVGIVDVHW